MTRPKLLRVVDVAELLGVTKATYDRTTKYLEVESEPECGTTEDA